MNRTEERNISKSNLLKQLKVLGHYAKWIESNLNKLGYVVVKKPDGFEIEKVVPNECI